VLADPRNEELAPLLVLPRHVHPEGGHGRVGRFASLVASFLRSRMPPLSSVSMVRSLRKIATTHNCVYATSV
jgi:hypothetical protein